MKFRLTIEADYEVTDDLAKRKRMYNATDPDDCAKVDETNDPVEMLEGADIVSHRVRVLGPYSTPGDPTKLDDQDLIIACGVHDDDCPCTYCAEWKKRRAVAFARWIISLDDPDGPVYEARRAVTMSQIIGKAREALNLPEEV